jgi:DNA-binding MarR family transcriptional regulator
VIARYQPLTATQLASLTSSDAFKVTRAIEVLVRRGLIRRDVDTNDRRRVSLDLTAAERKVYGDIERFVIRIERDFPRRSMRASSQRSENVPTSWSCSWNAGSGFYGWKKFLND